MSLPHSGHTSLSFAFTAFATSTLAGFAIGAT